MKAKVIETGEIIDVVEKYGHLISYWDSENEKEYSKLELDFNINDQTNNKAIDWEQRRYEIAKDIMAASFNQPMDGVSIASYVHSCVLFADTLIEELKKESK